MCGRYALFGPISRYREHFDAQDIEGFEFPPRFNLAPSQRIPVIRQDPDGSRRLVLAQWGLVPAWCKDPTQIQHPINAKAETAAIKPMFRDAFRRSRVLIPADVFYEWKPAAGGKQPYAIAMRDGLPFAMAGLLERWNGPSGDVTSFAILTTDANALVAQIHGRMPAIIRREDYGLWLDPKVSDIPVLQALLSPYPERLMHIYPVSKRVSNPDNEGPDLATPLQSPTTS